MVLLLKNHHYRPVRPVAKGFPEAWLRSQGACASGTRVGEQGLARFLSSPKEISAKCLLPGTDKKAANSSVASASSFRAGVFPSVSGSERKAATKKTEGASVSIFRLGCATKASSPKSRASTFSNRAPKAKLPTLPFGLSKSGVKASAYVF